MRGQSALEFLTTYGSALLITLIIIGVASYMGVVNPEKFLPEQCRLSPPLTCHDWLVTPREVVLTVSLIGNEPIVIERAEFTSHATGETCPSLIPQRVVPGRIAQIKSAYYCRIEGKGSKIRMDIHLTYRKEGSSVRKTLHGTLISRIERSG